MKLNVLFLIILIYPISPFFSFLWLLLYNSSTKITNGQIQLFSLFGALIIGYINSNKVVEGDLLNYYSLYESAESHGFLEYVLIYGKDFFFTTLTYLLNIFTKGDFKTYIFFLTASATFILLKGILKLTAASNLNKQSSFFVIALTLLFFQIFEYSGHLIRQYISICIMFYGLGLYFEKKHKKAIVWVLLSILSHLSSMVLIIPIIFQNVKNWGPRHFLKYFAFLILISISIVLNGDLRTGLYLIFYRIFNPVNDIELQISPVIYFYSLANLIIWTLLRKKDPIIKSLTNIQVFLFTTSFLSLIISSELFVRLIFPTYFLFYYQLAVLIYQVSPDSRISKNSLFFLILGNLGLFIYGLTNSNWTFDNLSTLLFTTFRIHG